MTKISKGVIEQTLGVLADHPYLAVDVLVSRAEMSEQGLYYAGVQLEDGKHGISFNFAVDDEKASRLFNFLHDLTEGAVPNWEDHAYAQEVMRHPEAAIARDGDA